MLVRDVLDIVKSKAFGRDNYDVSQDEMLLQYLNISHMELWDSIAHLDDAYLVQKNVNVTRDNPVASTEGNRPIKARLQVFKADGSSLREISKIDLVKNPRFASAQNFYYRDTPCSFRLTYALAEGDSLALSFFYVPDAVALGLEDDLSLIYPDVRLQYLLSDGAFYHLCFAEEGTRPIRQQDKSFLTWQQALVNEQASLMNARPFSTYGIL